MWIWGVAGKRRLCKRPQVCLTPKPSSVQRACSRGTRILRSQPLPRPSNPPYAIQNLPFRTVSSIGQHSSSEGSLWEQLGFLSPEPTFHQTPSHSRETGPSCQLRPLEPPTGDMWLFGRTPGVAGCLFQSLACSLNHLITPLTLPAPGKDLQGFRGWQATSPA